jgi:hypothetical protein
MTRSYGKKLIRLLSIEGRPTNQVLAQIWMGVFFIHPVSDIIFAMFFFRDRLRTVADHILISTGLQSLIPIHIVSIRDE